MSNKVNLWFFTLTNYPWVKCHKSDSRIITEREKPLIIWSFTHAWILSDWPSLGLFPTWNETLQFLFFFLSLINCQFIRVISPRPVGRGRVWWSIDPPFSWKGPQFWDLPIKYIALTCSARWFFSQKSQKGPHFFYVRPPLFMRLATGLITDSD